MNGEQNIKLDIVCAGRDVFDIAFFSPLFSNSVGIYNAVDCSVVTGEKQAIVRSNLSGLFPCGLG